MKHERGNRKGLYPRISSHKKKKGSGFHDLDELQDCFAAWAKKERQGPVGFLEFRAFCIGFIVLLFQIK